MVSSPLSAAKRIAEILMLFPAGTGLNLQYRFFVAAQNPATNTAIPGGGELTATEVGTGIFVGDAIAYTVPFQYEFDQVKRILILYATNNTAGALNAAAIPIVEAD